MSSDKKTPRDLDFAPSGFFAFRSPLLPYEELEAWTEGLSSATTLGDANGPDSLASAFERDLELLRTRLQAMLERPEIKESVFVASPSLTDGLGAWISDPAGKKGQRAERALVRYLLRMTGRATPFGLFSGCSMGTLGAESRLRLAPRAEYSRHTRLDMDYLFALAEDLAKEAAYRAELTYRPNTSLYDAAGRMRYAEARLDGKVRSHHLVAVTPTSYLEETLARAKSGARLADLAQALVDSDPDGEITLDDANDYLSELVDSQLLVPDLGLPVTGPESIHGLIEQLTHVPAGETVRAKLESARDAIAALDAAGLGSDAERYREIARDLGELPTSVELSRLFQVDMVKPVSAASLGPAVMAEVDRGIDLHYRLFGRGRQEAIDKFRTDFGERYGEGRWVPLLQVLDEEVGIGFDRSSSAGAEASPLLAGLNLGGPQNSTPTVPWGGLQGAIFAKYEAAIASGALEITLDDAEIEKLASASSGDRLPLPDAFQVMGTLVAASDEALDRGEFKFVWRGAGGPSGARLLGRFCHADPELESAVREHLRAEEALRPEAIFAEVVHLPQGRIGNILARPVLREWEIPYLGRSGAPLDRQIPVQDLDVTVAGGRIVLRSRSLRREVIARLSSAHNFSMGSLGLYRFLCTIQSQNLALWLSWGWGALDGSSFLPRVTAGRLVLSRATWKMNEDEIKPLAKLDGAERFAAVHAWREKRRVPRLVALADGDNELLVDFDNPLAVDTFFDLVEERRNATLHEFYPGPDEFCVHGPEGRFLNEVVIPYVRKAAPATAPPPPTDAADASQRRRQIEVSTPVPRTFPPGSEWLYLKLYTGSSTADGALREAVAPAVREILSRGFADGWFFIRYSDPDWHVRVRFHGEPNVLLTQALPLFQSHVLPLVGEGRLHKILLDTYERETERYGGPHGIGISEKLFQMDSDAALAVVETLEGDEGADARWRLAFRGIDLLLQDLGLDVPTKVAVMGRMKENFAKEFGGGKNFEIQIDQKYRKEKGSLPRLLVPTPAADDPLAPGYAILAERSRRSAPIYAELARLEAEGLLTETRADLAPSYIHMWVNRMIRSAARAHEAVLYGLLHREYQAQAARARGGDKGERRDKEKKGKGEKVGEAKSAKEVIGEGA